MKVTDEMVARANTVFWHKGDVNGHLREMKAALEAALAPYEAPPFVLSEFELTAKARLYARLCGGEALDATDTRRVYEAIDRANKTLGVAPAVEPLSSDEEQLIRNAEEDAEGDEREAQLQAICALIRKRFSRSTPKPLHRVAFEASIASKHTADSPEYWQEITAAVLAADKAGAK